VWLCCSKALDAWLNQINLPKRSQRPTALSASLGGATGPSDLAFFVATARLQSYLWTRSDMFERTDNPDYNRKVDEYIARERIRNLYNQNNNWYVPPKQATPSRYPVRGYAYQPHSTHRGVGAWGKFLALLFLAACSFYGGFPGFFIGLMLFVPVLLFLHALGL
jgi:hypothetical protein